MNTPPNMRKLAKRRKTALFQLNFGQVIVMDSSIGLCLLAILYVVALTSTSYQIALVKAQLVEVFSFFPSRRLDLQEQFALTGEGFPTLQAAATHPAGKTPERGEEKGVGHENHGRVLHSVTQTEYSLIARGTLGEAATPFFLTYTPAVIASGIPGSMMWLCGNRKPVAGWVRLPGPTGTDIPAKYLHSVCRDNKEP